MPPALPSEAETIITNERLRLLAWGYYSSGALGAIFACFFLIYAAGLGAMSFIPESSWDSPSQRSRTGDADSEEFASDRGHRGGSNAPPKAIFRILAMGFSGITLLGWILGGLTAFAGHCIQKRKHRLFINIMAAYNTLWLPYGTVLGVCSFLVVNSAESMRQFEARRNPRANEGLE